MIHFVFNNDKRDATTGIYLMDAARRAGLECSWRPKGVDQYSMPQVIIKVDDGDVDHYDYSKSSAPSFWWFIDPGTDFERGVRIGQNFNVTLCSQLPYVEALRGRGLDAYWLPLACDPMHHNTIYPKVSSRPIDLGFSGSVSDCGGWNKARPEILQEATERFKNCIVRETVKGQNSMINGSCKVILNDNPYNNINMRHFEAISAGAVLVTRKPQESAIEQLGLSDSVLFYENKKEAMDQIDFALKNIKRFDEPAEALASHYWQNHSYTNRLNEIIEMIRTAVEK